MDAPYAFREFQEYQRRTLDGAVAAYQAYLDAWQAGLPFKGGMHWKKIKGHEYLYKYRDRYGQGHSLGPRSPATEALFHEFTRQRRELTALRQRRRREEDEIARFCRAALLNRVPEPVGRILRRLEQRAPGGAEVMVLGSQALYAYEFAAGVSLTAPKTSLLREGAGQRLTLAASVSSPADLLQVLRRTDRSFQPRGDGWEAVNRDGFQVRLITPLSPRGPSRNSQPGVPGGAADLTVLLNSPKFSQVVIDRRGRPATMLAPDPRVLARHLLRRSRQADRTSAQRDRDLLRATALAELILRYLPQYHFFAADLQGFPPQVRRRAEGLMEGYDAAEDLEEEE
jgi:hypothetical protein